MVASDSDPLLSVSYQKKALTLWTLSAEARVKLVASGVRIDKVEFLFKKEVDQSVPAILTSFQE